MTNGTAPERYTYDADGERVLRTAAGVTTVYFAGVWEQIVGGQTYTYDANGNLLSGGGRTFTWTADNLLASAPNGLGISGGAPMDRESGRADTSLQKSPESCGRGAPSAACSCWTARLLAPTSCVSLSWAVNTNQVSMHVRLCFERQMDTLR